MAESWPTAVELSDYVSDAESAQLKVRVPAPVVLLVADLLTRIPRRVGVRGPGELLAALIVQALDDPHGLPDAVGDYRETRVHAVLQSDATEGAVPLPARPPLQSN